MGNQLKEISLRIVRSIVYVLLVAAGAGAQDQLAQSHLPSHISGEMHAGVDATIGNGTEGDGAGVYAPAVTPIGPFPDAPKPHRVIDKKFIIVMGALGGAESMRFTTRKLVLEHEYAAGAPWVTQVPSTQGWVGKYSLIYASELLVAYELKKPHSWMPGDKVVQKLWWAYPAAMTALHIKNAVGNIRTQGPGGCTSMECAMQMQ
jgi:hypothetical protein